MRTSLDSIEKKLIKAGYQPNENILYALFTSLSCDKPLLIEGDPGVGKTYLAKALAEGMGLPYIRLQMYEGLTSDDILYDYDYQKQLLTLEAMKPKLEEEYKNLNLKQTMDKVLKSMDFYGEDFLIKRPILQSISEPKGCVLCIDEIDKAPEEIEYMLYEFLENYSITIPQLGKIDCKKKPIVLITSNNYREISGAMKRRCNYLYIERKTMAEIIDILVAKVKVDENIARGIAKCIHVIEGTSVKQPPSIAEAIEYADFLNKSKKVTEELAINSLNILVKNHKDLDSIKKIVTENGELIWS